jgi:hypothetical protein
MQLFRKILKLFFDLENIEKTTPKSCIFMAFVSFFLCSPDCPKQPRTSYLFNSFIQLSLLRSLVHID